MTADTSSRPLREVRAVFGATSVRVYQAFSPEIAEPALKAQRFVDPFSKTRMTWIKPSFCWMMYRSGWAQKQDQERVLAVDLSRTGFEWALEHSCLSSFDRGLYPNSDAWNAQLRTSPVRIQWDPERTLTLAALPWRTIQLGLSGCAVRFYVDDWIVGIHDITPLVCEISRRIEAGDLETARRLAPVEVAYPLRSQVAEKIGASR